MQYLYILLQKTLWSDIKSCCLWQIVLFMLFPIWWTTSIQCAFCVCVFSEQSLKEDKSHCKLANCFKLLNISGLSQSKIESTISSFISFHLCPFCIGVMIGRSYLSQSSVIFHIPASLLLFWRIISAYPLPEACTRPSERQQTNICSSTQYCNNPCVFTVLSLRCIIYCTFLSINSC